MKMKTLAKTILLPLLVSWALPEKLPAQFAYTNTDGIWSFTTNNRSITITGFTGSDSVTVPDSINFIYYPTDRPPIHYGDWPVVSIGSNAFNSSYDLNSVVIPNSITNIGDSAFEFCIRLSNITIPGSVTTIGSYAFFDTGLTNVTILEGVASIGYRAFFGCFDLSSVTISGSVTNIGTSAFCASYYLTAISVEPSNPAYCSVDGVLFDKNLNTLLTFPGTKSGNYTIPATVTNVGTYSFYECRNLALYFQGDSPIHSDVVFSGVSNLIIYYLPGTTGWGSTYESVPEVLWNPGATTFSTAGGQFGFNITGPTNAVIVMEACTNLSNPVWLPISTNTLTGGTNYFSDPVWTNYSGRFYRICSQ